MLRVGLLLLLSLLPLTGQSHTLKYPALPYPDVTADTWVLIEVWPEVGDITLSAYFMHSSGAKNQNLCEAIKRALDRDSAVLEKQNRQKFTSARHCLSLPAAVKAGYVDSKAGRRRN